jgi:hypothetical protein
MAAASIWVADMPGALCGAGVETPNADVVLVDAALLDGARGEGSAASRMIALCDGDRDAPPAGFAAVDKYAGVANIISAIRIRFAESSGRPAPAVGGDIGEGRTEVYSFFSAAGGAGTSSIAYASACELSKYRGRRTCYISLEPYEAAAFAPAYQPAAGPEQGNDARGRGAAFEYEEARGHEPIRGYGAEAYLYYYLKEDEKRLPRLLEAVTETDRYGVIRFRPSPAENKLRELAESEFLRFLDHLAAALYLDCVVVDRGVGIGNIFADQRLVYVKKDGSVKAPKLPEGVLTVRNMCGDDPEHAPGDILIPADDADFHRTENGVEISLTNVFGRGVKEIVDRLLGAERAEPERED